MGKQLYQTTNGKLMLGVCEENKDKNNCQLKYFVVKGLTLEACRRTVTQPIVMTTAKTPLK